MKRVLFTICAGLAACSLLAQTSFTSGKLRYEVLDENAATAQIVCKNANNAEDAYQNITASDMKTEVTYNGKTYTVIGIGANAFYKGSLSAGVNRIPEGYIFIDNGAFDHCEGGSCTLPSTLTMLSPLAFVANRFQSLSVVSDNPVYARLLTTQHSTVNVSCITNKEGNKLIAVPGSKPRNYDGDNTTYVTVFNIPDQITEIGEYAFCQTPNFVRVGIPASVTKIGDGAFYNCEKITNVTLTNPNVELGEMVWSSCYALSSVTLPEGLEKLGRQAFCFCNLTSITLPEGMKSLGTMAFTSNNITSISIPSTLELIDSCAFQNNENLTSVNIKNVKRMDHFAFMGCSALTTFTGNNKLEYLESSVFCYTGMVNAQLPEGLLHMDGNTFFRTTSLRNITIPSTVEYIEYNPIVGCTGVNRVQVAEGSEHFAELDSCLYEIVDGQPVRLISVPSARVNKVLVVRDGVTKIGRQAAREVALTEAYLPASMQEIETSAFGSVNSLTKVSCMAVNPPIADSQFSDNTYANATLYVPMRSLELYQNAEVWKEFQHIEGVDTGGLRGDVNGDGDVNVMDITALIDEIMNDGTNPAADVNEDGDINVRDITELIDIIMES